MNRYSVKRYSSRSCRSLLAVLVVGSFAFRFIPRAGEFYACRIYPAISAFLSAIASLVPFSLDEWVVVALSGAAVGFSVLGPSSEVSLGNAYWDMRPSVCFGFMSGFIGDGE